MELVGTMRRDVSQKECEWLTEEFKKGDIIYQNNPAGDYTQEGHIIVSRLPKKPPYFALPKDSVFFKSSY